MQSEPRSLRASLFWHILLPRGAALLVWWGANQLLQMPPTVVWGLIAADALFLVWLIRAHLRAADEHMTGSGAMAPVWGGYLLMLIAILASVTLWWQALLVAHRPPAGIPYAEQRALDRAARYSLTLSADGTSLVFDGEVTFGLTKALKTQLQDHPGVRQLRLSSPGGLIYEARGAARLIAARSLATTAEGLCASACTLMFAAGERRSLGPQGQLGFHGYALENFGGLPQVDLAKEQGKDRDFLIRQGITAGFVEQIYATPSSALWIPSPEVMRRAGLLLAP
jgi:hypothetical protein